MAPKTGDSYLVVSLDGGGIRGIVSSRLLERLESAHPGVLERVDLFAGTSTGGILALSLAAGRSPAEMTALYLKHGREVFAHRRARGKVDSLVHPHYRSEPLKRMLDSIFGEMTLGDLPRKVLVSAFEVNAIASAGSGAGAEGESARHAWKPKFFHNFPEVGADDLDQRVVDVALRTSAAPTFFPIYQGFIDGGVVAANPSLCALVQALDPRAAGRTIGDIRLLSIGTGAYPRSIEIDDPNWGFVRWAPHLLSIMFEGGTSMVDFQCRQLLGPAYLRIDPPLPQRIGLDSVEEAAALGAVADAEDLTEASRWLDEALGS